MLPIFSYSFLLLHVNLMLCRSYGLLLFVCTGWVDLGRFENRGLSNVGIFVGRSVLDFFAGLSYVVSEGSSSIGLVGGLLFGRE